MEGGRPFADVLEEWERRQTSADVGESHGQTCGGKWRQGLRGLGHNPQGLPVVQRFE